MPTTSRIDPERIAAALPGYELGGELGRGGFGVVVAGRHRLIDRAVAVKILPDAEGGPHSTDGDMRSRFLGEARVLAGIDHSHVVRIYDYVEHDGLCLLVMEQLTGGSLRGRSLRGPEQVGAIGVAAAVALAAAHERGVLHRDVKPDNLLFTGDGIPKVTDFGIAKIVAATAATTTGLVGTPRYMAPEQITGGRLGPGTDLYALGVVLYELFAGRSPFPPDLPVAGVLHHHLAVPPLPLVEAPGPIADVIVAAMAKEAGWRPASALEFATRLAAATTASLGPGWLAASGIPVSLPDEVLSAAGHQPGNTTPRPGSGPPGGPAPMPPPASPPYTPTPPGRAPFAPTPPASPPFAHTPPGSSPPGPLFGPTSTPASQVSPTHRSRRARPAAGSRRRPWFLAGVGVVAVLAIVIGLLVGLGALSGGGRDERQPAYAGSPVTLPGLAKAGALALAVDGSLYLTDPGDDDGQGQVVRLTAAGKAGRTGGSGPRPSPSGDATAPSPSPTPRLGDGGRSLAAELREPAGIAIGPDGSQYIAETGAGRVRRLAPDATISTVAGVGPASSDGFTTDTGAAARAHLDDPTAVAVDDHGVVYIAEGYRIRSVEAGQISTVAGRQDEFGSAGDGGPAVNATLYRPSGLALAPDGSLLVADEGNDTVRRIDRSGRISLVAGTAGTSGRAGDGRAATAAQLDNPQGLAVGADGSVYIADKGNNVVRKVDRHGLITTVAGTGSVSGSDRDGALATQTSLSGPAGVVVDPSGALFIACSGDGTVRRVGPDGFMTTSLRPPES